MKNSFKILSACLAASLAFVSCDKESLTKSDNGASKEGARVVTVSFSHATKSALGDDGFTPHFSNGDVIKVFKGSDKEDCTVEVGVDGTATISIKTEALKTGALTAVYPADAYSETEPYYTVGSSQDGTFANANICTATISDGSNPKAEFVNQTAILRFYVDESIGVKSITVKSSNDNIATGSNTITVDPEGDDTLLHIVTDDPKKRVCYVAALPGTSTSTLTFTSVTTTQTACENCTVSRKVENTKLAASTLYNAFIPYYIDLGEAGKWGYCNIGAFFPEDYGQYFMWGETDGHNLIDNWEDNWDDDYGEELYYNVFGDGDLFDGYLFDWFVSPLNNGEWDYDINYFSNQQSTVCPDGVLSRFYDAAHKNWGDGWRMPREDEFTKLIAVTSSIWEACNSINGRTFMFNGNSIFLPASGRGIQMDLFFSSNAGQYWSSSLGYIESGDACLLEFGSNGVDLNFNYIYKGQPVRPFSEYSY